MMGTPMMKYAAGAAAGYYLYEKSMHGAFMGAAAVSMVSTLTGMI